MGSVWIWSLGRTALVSLVSLVGIVTLALNERWGTGALLFLVSFIVAAGGFIYIAGSDLIPELHREPNIGRSLMQLLAIALGVGVMALLLLFE